MRRWFRPKPNGQTGLPDPNPKPTPAWLGGWVRWRCAITKKHTFLCVFHVQPKHQNGAVSADIEGFRTCFSKPSDGAPKWALLVRLRQKERLKSPQKSPILENQAFFGHFLAIWAKTAILVILASHFRARVDTPEKKPHLGFCLDQRDRATVYFPTGCQAKFSTGGGVMAPSWARRKEEAAKWSPKPKKRGEVSAQKGRRRGRWESGRDACGGSGARSAVARHREVPI